MMIGKHGESRKISCYEQKQILEKLNRENPSRKACISDDAMIAWEYLEEPINENISDSEEFRSPDNDENPQKNSAEEEVFEDEF